MRVKLAAVGLDDETASAVRAEERSRVAFDIEEMGSRVKLSLVHTGFAPGSRVLELISGGWPAVISSLKTMLDTGEALPPETLARR